jgi:hypothetical protein
MNAQLDLQPLRRAASSGSPDALLALAEALTARGDAGEARATLLPGAHAGHADVQFALARLSLYDPDGARDVPQAIEWLQRAERAQHAGAAYLLASISLGGVAGDRDFGLMGPRLLAAARAGLVPALRALAMVFGRDRDNLTAMRQSESLLAQAAAQRDGVSAALLAERMRHGELTGDADYSLDDLDALAAQAGIARLPSLPGLPVARNRPNSGELHLGLEAYARAPAFAVACQAPRIAMAEGLLSSEECRYVIAMGMPHLAPAQVVDPATGERIANPLLTAQQVSFVPALEDFALRLLQWRMASAMGTGLINAEPLSLLRYAPGEQYRPHRDDLAPEILAAYQPGAGQRSATVWCYLNDVDAGGETVFPVSGGVIAPAAGRAVGLLNLDAAGQPDPDTLHAGLPVERGEKWLATLWFRERAYRAF